MAILAAVQALNKIVQTSDYSMIKKNGLDESYFVGYEEQFKFIRDHVGKFGNVPDLPTFLEKFPQWTPIEVNETDEYLLDKLYEDHSYHKLAPFLVQLGTEIRTTDSRLVFDHIMQEINNLRPHTVCKGTDIISEAQERYDAYLLKQQNPEKSTISTGLAELDQIFGGWDYGDELVTIVARTNVGKSWMLLKFLVEAWKQGKRVGLYSGEMNSVKLGYRFDSWFQHFSNRSLVRGEQVDGYKEFIENLKTQQTPFIIVQQKDFGGRPTVQKIKNFVEENGIEIMGIDQYSLMDDGRAAMRDPTRIRLAHISEDLFLLSSEYRIPVLGLAQANRAATDKDGNEAPGLENIKESDDIAHNSSKCIGMRQTNFGLVLDITKNREGRVGDKLLYDWTIDAGQMVYIPTENDAAPAATRQAATTKAVEQHAQMSTINPF